MEEIAQFFVKHLLKAAQTGPFRGEGAPSFLDINSSGTRREELLLDPKEMELVYRLRRVLSDMNPVEAVEPLKGPLEKVPSKAQFLMSMKLD